MQHLFSKKSFNIGSGRSDRALHHLRLSAAPGSEFLAKYIINHARISALFPDHVPVSVGVTPGENAAEAAFLLHERINGTSHGSRIKRVLKDHSVSVPCGNLIDPYLHELLRCLREGSLRLRKLCSRLHDQMIDNWPSSQGYLCHGRTLP